MAKTIIRPTGPASQGLVLASPGVAYELPANTAFFLGNDATPVAIKLVANAARASLTLKGDVAAFGDGHVGVELGGLRNRLTVDRKGAIEADTGVHVLASAQSVSITNTGQIIAEDGILIDAGARAGFTNRGTIAATHLGISVDGDGSVISNAGSIIASNGSGDDATAILVGGRFSKITNSAKGEIAGTIGIDSAAGHTGDTIIIRNSGTLSGSVAALRSTDANVELTNLGTIAGNIALGSGNDVLDLRKGTVSGTVAGGNGNDTYYTSKTGLVLLEAADGGNDTLNFSAKVALGYNVVLAEHFENLELAGTRAINGIGNAAANQIVGNAGRNQLLGLDGDDILDGGKGRDLLTGGDGADHFVFARGSGRDVVTDFANGIDQIDLYGFGKGFDTIEEIKAKALTDGNDVVLAFSTADRLTLTGVTIDQLDATDFRFF